LARKTPLKKPNRGEGIIFTKPRPKSVYDFYDFFGLVSILDFIGAKGDGGGDYDRSYKTCKVQIKMSPPTNQYPVFTGWMPFLSSNQQQRQSKSS